MMGKRTHTEPLATSNVPNQGVSSLPVALVTLMFSFAVGTASEFFRKNWVDNTRELS